MNETKFDGMGKIYAKFRPTYPQEFIEYLCSDVGINKDSIIADIGSGTGILTRQLLEVGNKIFPSLQALFIPISTQNPN